MDRQALEKLSRTELISKASGIGVPRAEVMTRMELVDEIVRRSITDESQRRRARGWLGVARDLVAGLIDQGLNMSDAAELVRGSATRNISLRHQPPVATVTLAEIYASQGHTKRARNMLDEVLAKEPDHQFARALRERLSEHKRAKSNPPPEQEVAEEVPADAAVEVPPSVPPPPAVAVDATVETPVTPSQAEFVDVEAATVAGQAAAVSEPADAAETTDPAPAQKDDAEAVTDPAPAAAPALPEEVDENAVTPPAPGVASASAEPAPSPPSAEAVSSSDVTPFVPTRDVLLVRRKDSTRVSLYWELVPGHAMETVVRLVAFVPDWSGAKRVEHQLHAHSAVGQATVEVPEGAEVRAVVGSHLGGAFRPLAVGVEICGEAQPEVAWAPSPVFRQRVTPALRRAFAALQG